MSLLWKDAAGMGEMPESHDLDKAREHIEDQHADDNTFVPNWEPLHNSDIHPAEHDGFMFSSRVHSKDMFGRQNPELAEYKHGITRKSIALDPDGNPYEPFHHQNFDPKRGPWYNRAIKGYHDPTATEHLHNIGHYDDLKQLSAEPHTKYNDDYIADRNRRLQDAGWNVMQSNPSQSEVPDFPPEH